MQRRLEAALDHGLEAVVVGLSAVVVHVTPVDVFESELRYGADVVEDVAEDILAVFVVVAPGI